MKRVVWKYVLEVGDNKLMMPASAVILHVAARHERVTMWTLVDPDDQAAGEHMRYFRVEPTGIEFDVDPVRLVQNTPVGQTFRTMTGAPNLTYRGTALLHGGTSVWHVFEVR